LVGRAGATGKAKTPDHAAYGPVGGKIGYDGAIEESLITIFWL
jgi:hypothetical protein